MNYCLPTKVDIAGVEYPIRSDFRVILEIIELLQDDLTPAEKAEGVLTMFYEEIPSDAAQAINKCFEFMDMGDKPKKSPRLVDWEKDFNYIIAPINRVLGYECRSAEYLHWWTFLAAFMEIGGDCVFSQIVNIRDKLARGKKLEKYEQEWLRKNRQLVHLPQRTTAAEDKLLNEWLGVKT